MFVARERNKEGIFTEKIWPHTEVNNLARRRKRVQNDHARPAARSIRILSPLRSSSNFFRHSFFHSLPLFAVSFIFLIQQIAENQAPRESLVQLKRASSLIAL